MKRECSTEQHKHSCSLDGVMPSGWYLVQSKPKQEERACNNINQLNLAYYCPWVLIRQQRQPLFPQYFFVYLSGDVAGHYWRVRHARGVKDFVRLTRLSQHHTALPKPLLDGEKVIQQIQAIEAHYSKPATKQTVSEFSPGESLLIDNPLYHSLKATFIKSCSWQRALVLLEYLQTYRDRYGVKQRIMGKKQVQVSMNQLYRP